METRFLLALRTTTGIALSVAAALVVALCAAGLPGVAFIPLVFAVVLILLSWRFGAAVSIAGSLLAALIFARFPAHRFHVADSAGHNSLVWMILIAVVGSYLLFPSQHTDDRSATLRMHRPAHGNSADQNSIESDIQS